MNQVSSKGVAMNEFQVERNIYGMPTLIFQKSGGEPRRSPAETDKGAGADPCTARAAHPEVAEEDLSAVSQVPRTILIMSERQDVVSRVKRQSLKRGLGVISVNSEYEFWREVFRPEIRMLIVDFDFESQAGDGLRRSLFNFGFFEQLPVLFVSPADERIRGLTAEIRKLAGKEAVR